MRTTSDNARDAAKQQALEILEEIARRDGEPIPYSKLAAKITAVRYEPDDPDFHSLLGELSEASNAESRGMISVLVVHAGGDGRPGVGFFTLAKKLGRDVSDKDRCWAEELRVVYGSARR
jgi:hypothetical protein